MNTHQKILLVVFVVSIFLILVCCESKEKMFNEEIIALVHESSAVYSEHNIEKYATYYTGDFYQDNVSAPGPLGRNEFLSKLSKKIEKDDSVFHYQERILVSGEFSFFDECSMVVTNPVTGAKLRTFHADIVEFEDRKMKVMTTFSDGAKGAVALGQMEPPLPAPPLPGRRPWPPAAPEPTRLKPMGAHTEFQKRWNRQDATGILEMLHEDAEILFAVYYDTIMRDAYAGWMDVMFNAFPDLRIEPIRTFDMGDGWVVSELKMTGTNTGSYMGNEATEKVFELRAALANRYDNQGLAREVRLYFDSMTIMNDLGLKPVRIEK
jgi:predicted ester cyclase